MNRYIVADDGSDAAEAAWRWAQHRAAQDGGSWVRVHVGDPAGSADRARAGGEPAGRGIQLSGRVPDALAAFAGPDDVLVLGTGKTGYIHGRVSGLTGLMIVARAQCAVAVIPTIDLRFRAGVVTGVDRPEHAADTARAAAREAARNGDGVQVIHARERTDPLGDSRPLDIAANAIRTDWPTVTVRTRVVSVIPARALLDAAQSASLLVIGRGGEDGAPDARRMPGPVALEILLNANSPVLVTAPSREETVTF